MQTIQNCEDKAVMDETASESWQKLLSTATYESIPTWRLGSCNAVIELCFQWWYNDSTGVGAVRCSSAWQLQGTACTPERRKWVCGIGAVQGGVRIRGVVNSNVADDIGSLLHTQTAGGKKKTNNTKQNKKHSSFSHKTSPSQLSYSPPSQVWFWLIKEINNTVDMTQPFQWLCA